MLLEPGPLPYFTEAEIPRLVEYPNTAATAGQMEYAIGTGAAALDWQYVGLAGAGANTLEGATVEIGAAAAELYSQAGYSDPEIHSAYGGAQAGESELASYSGELAGELQTPIPPEPPVPIDGYGGVKILSDYPFDVWDQTVRDRFESILGRSASQADVDYARMYVPNVTHLEAWIRAGAPRPGVPEPEPEPTPEPEPEWAEWDAGVNNLFRQIGGRDAFDGEINYARRFYPDLQAVQEWILAGTPG